MKRPEKIIPHYGGPGVRRWYKRMAARLLRHAARRNPEGAPMRTRYFGWVGP
jgi:hypothetical protein